MDGEDPRPTRRRRIDGTILLGGLLSALLHAVGVALLLMTPTATRPIEQTAYTVEVVDPDALGGELLEGPIGGAPEPEAAPEPEPAPEPEVVAKAEPPEEAAPDAVPVETVQPTPAPKPTAESKPTAKKTAAPKPKATATKVAKAPKRTPEKKAAPKPEKTAAAPKQVAAAKPADDGGGATDDGDEDSGEAQGDLDGALTAAIAKLEGSRGAGRGEGGTAESRTGPPGVGGEGPGGGGKVRGIAFVAYYTQMLSRIKDRWTWSGDRRDLRVTVRFSILPSGDIANLRLVQRSGEASYDASVERAIKGASPFAPPPEAYQRDFADVELTFRPADLEVSG